MSNSQSTASVIITSIFFYLVVAILAGLTMLTHISQLLGIQFKLYFWTALGTCLAIVVVWFAASKKWIAKINTFAKIRQIE